MGNSMTCFERWGKRHPDGPLLHISKTTAKRDLSVSSTAASFVSSSVSEPKTEPKVSKPSDFSGRQSKRKPTYAAEKSKFDTDDENLADYEEDFSDEDMNDSLDAKQITLNKLYQFKRSLTKMVKLQSSSLISSASSVRVSISKDGESIVWFRRRKSDEESENQKELGSFRVRKIQSVKVKSDNPRSLEVAVQGSETFSFRFVDKEARQSWQTNLDLLKEFLVMA